MLQEKLNNENILVRGVIAGVLNILNNNISYEQTRCATGTEEIILPWYYNQSGDERFMQDFYTNYAFCLNDKHPRKIDGNMDMIPRGVITYNGLTVDASRLTSRFVEGNYNKESDGKIETYSSYLFSIPVNIKFNAEIYVDSLTDCLKIEQSLIERLYKVITTYFLYKGMRIGIQIGFPDNITTDKVIQYSYDTNLRINKLSFSIEVETYLPSFDETTESLYTNNIKGIGMRIYTDNNPSDGNIWFETLKSFKHTLNKNVPLLLEWNYNDENSIIHKVDLSYIKNGIETFIVKGLHNNMSYVWSIPKDISDFTMPVFILNDEDIILRPDIIITPQDGHITHESFKINNPGKFKRNNYELPVSLEYKDINNKLKEVEGITFIINDGILHDIQLNKDIKVNIPKHSDISIKIYNSINHDVFDEIQNVKML